MNAVIPANEIKIVAAPVTTRPKLAQLQLLRGVAATMVVLHHSVLALASRHLISPSISDRVYCTGDFAVAVFFVISGFIIFRSSWRSFQNKDISGFVSKRLIRILPVYWMATAMFVALSPHRGEYGIADMLFSIVLVPHVITGGADLHPLVGQGWTLQYEVLFYAIFAMGLPLGRRAGTMAVVAVLIALVAFGASQMAMSDNSEPATVLQYWTRPIILLFAVGIGLGVLREQGFRAFPVPRGSLALWALPIAWLAYCVLSPLSANRQTEFPAVLAIWALSSFCVFLSVFARAGQGGRFEPLAEAFGDASYSVYLFHTFVLSALLRLRVQDISPVLFVVAALVLANVLGLLMYQVVEKPLLRVLRRRLLGAS